MLGFDLITANLRSIHLSPKNSNLSCLRPFRNLDAEGNHRDTSYLPYGLRDLVDRRNGTVRDDNTRGIKMSHHPGFCLGAYDPSGEACEIEIRRGASPSPVIDTRNTYGGNG